MLNVLDIDDCASAPCQHGGTCTDEINGYSCECSAGYTGNDCQTGKILNICILRVRLPNIKIM